MKAMIFAAGIGSRLKPFTESHPKALAPVCGVPMLERILLKLHNNGIRNVTINVHHFAAQILQFLNEHNNFGMDISISEETAMLLDTGGGLLKARPMLDDGSNEPILLHNADILTDMPIGDMLACHRTNNADATLFVSRRQSSRLLYFSDTGTLCGWQNTTSKECKPTGFTPTSHVALAFCGIHLVQPSLFPSLEKYAQIHGKAFSIIRFYLDNIKSLKIAQFIPQKQCLWHDIGTPEKLVAAEKCLKNR